jgi:DNA polymerase-4
VIATCNYEARRFGVRSAMATSQALQRCPDLIVLAPSMEKYRIASREILAIYRAYTEMVEPLSLDEAYLDVTRSSQCQGSATLIAKQIRERIVDAVGITASAGIAPNKFLAKIASDWNKPDGQFVIRPHEIDSFVAVLPVDKLHGVGKVTAARLHKLGAKTCGEMREWPLPQLQHHFGKFGDRLFELCRGIDQREVSSNRERKSVSVEETYVTDLPDLTSCRQRLPEVLHNLVERVRRAKAERNIDKLFIKLRFADFKRTTAECVGTRLDVAVFERLLATGFERGKRPVRLMGAGVRVSDGHAGEQPELFANE